MHRIVLVDDHAIVREGFRALIEREGDIAIVGECGDVAAAETTVGAVQPDLVVLDLSLPDGGGLALIPKLRASVPGLRVIVLSMHDSEPYISESLARGANGYVSKGAAADELTSAIRVVMAGGSYLSCDLSAQRPQYPSPGVAELSPRECEVLVLLARGMVPKQIAAELGIGVKTTYVHRAHVLEKLGVRNEVELYRVAVENNLLEARSGTADGTNE